jgi:hypothetical protein
MLLHRIAMSLSEVMVVRYITIIPDPSLISYILAQAGQSLNSFSGSCNGNNWATGDYSLKASPHAESTIQQQAPLFINCLFILEIHEPRTLSAQARSNV